MIWGIQWDETLKWIIDTRDKTYAQVYNSNSWGNHRDSGGGNTKRPTGYSENWKANNIYDLAGNVSDWTMGSNGSYNRYYRGGNYSYLASYYSAHSRSSDIVQVDAVPERNSDEIGYRVALYILQ